MKLSALKEPGACGPRAVLEGETDIAEGSAPLEIVVPQARVAVHPAEAVVVASVAGVDVSRLHGRIFVVAIAVADFDAVSVFVEALVGQTVAVVVDPIARFCRAGVDTAVVIVTVPWLSLSHIPIGLCAGQLRDGRISVAVLVCIAVPGRPVTGIRVRDAIAVVVIAIADLVSVRVYVGIAVVAVFTVRSAACLHGAGFHGIVIVFVTEAVMVGVQIPL